MDGILQRYKATLADNVFSRQEKQAILQAIRDRYTDKQQLAWLRSQIFDLAREHATSQNLGVILDWLEIANKTLLVETYVKEFDRLWDVMKPYTR